MDKKSLRIELNETEMKTIIQLRIIFDKNTNNAVVRKIIRLAGEKYL